MDDAPRLDRKPLDPIPQPSVDLRQGNDLLFVEGHLVRSFAPIHVENHVGEPALVGGSNQAALVGYGMRLRQADEVHQPVLQCTPLKHLVGLDDAVIAPEGEVKGRGSRRALHEVDGVLRHVKSLGGHHASELLHEVTGKGNSTLLPFLAVDLGPIQMRPGMQVVRVGEHEGDEPVIGTVEGLAAGVVARSAQVLAPAHLRALVQGPQGVVESGTELVDVARVGLAITAGDLAQMGVLELVLARSGLRTAHPAHLPRLMPPGIQLSVPSSFVTVFVLVRHAAHSLSK